MDAVPDGSPPDDTAPDRRKVEYAVTLGMLAALGKGDERWNKLAARLFIKAAVEFIGKDAALAEMEKLDA